MSIKPLPDGTPLAALDLGSNSFHLILARIVKGEISLIKRLGEKVQLAAGLDDNHWLSEEAQQRGLACLERMAPYLEGLPESQIRVVGTNALRAAHNSDEFTRRAAALLGVPVEIIAGREEARLIYSGVVQTSARHEGRRLVIDIGGGSTEFIIGENLEPQLLESLHMGCVSYTQSFFPDGQVTEKAFQQARLAALSELLPIRKHFLGRGWTLAQGSSGTLKNLALVLGQGELATITPKGLHRLEKELIKAGSANHWTAFGMRADRARVMPAGLAIASAFMESLQISELHYAEGALREGVLYELAGIGTQEDIRDRTVRSLQERYQVDLLQSQLVTRCALKALEQVADIWGLSHERWFNKLSWAAQLHEIGLTVAHTQYHKHGAYLIQHADLAGFTRLQQRMLAVLIRAHRRKFPGLEFDSFSAEDQLKLKRLARLLRLSVVLHHSRPETEVEGFTLHLDNSQKEETLTLEFEPEWLDSQPLLKEDLEKEARWLKAAGMALRFQ